MVELRDKLNFDLDGYSRQEVINVSSVNSFNLEHDTFYQNDITILQGTTELIENTDYELINEDAQLSKLAGQGVYREISIINNDYHNVDLDVDYTTIGDYTDFEDLKLLDEGIDTAEQNAKGYTDTHEEKASGVHGVESGQVASTDDVGTAEQNAKDYADALEAKDIEFDDTDFFESQSTVQSAIQALSSSGIVDEGSTDDGDYIRYENGWQICLSPNFENVQSTDQDGGLYFSSSEERVNWEFPVEFINGDSIFVKGWYDFSRSWVSLVDVSSTSAEVAAVSVRDNVSQKVKLIAIGRWK